MYSAAVVKAKAEWVQLLLTDLEMEQQCRLKFPTATLDKNGRLLIKAIHYPSSVSNLSQLSSFKSSHLKEYRPDTPARWIAPKGSLINFDTVVCHENLNGYGLIAKDLTRLVLSKKVSGMGMMVCELEEDGEGEKRYKTRGVIPVGMSSGPKDESACITVPFDEKLIHPNQHNLIKYGAICRVHMNVMKNNPFAKVPYEPYKIEILSENEAKRLLVMVKDPNNKNRFDKLKEGLDFKISGICNEARLEQDALDKETLRNTTIVFRKSEHRHHASFSVEAVVTLPEIRKYSAAELIRIEHAGPGGHDYVVTVIKVDYSTDVAKVVLHLNEEQSLCIRKSALPLDTPIRGWTVSKVFDEENIKAQMKRMKTVLKIAQNGKFLTGKVIERLLRGDIDASINDQCVRAMPGDRKRYTISNQIPNDEQVQVIKHMLRMKPFTCIRGPPGCGKSYTIAAVAHFLHDDFLRIHGRAPMILLAAPSNTAVDSLTEKLVSLNSELMRILRVYSVVREDSLDVTTKFDSVILHKMCQRPPPPESDTLDSFSLVRELIAEIDTLQKEVDALWAKWQLHSNGMNAQADDYELHRKQRHLTAETMKEKRDLLSKKKNELPDSVIASYKPTVILSTLGNCFDNRLFGIHYDIVIIDEAASALEHSVLATTLLLKRNTNSPDSNEAPIKSAFAIVGDDKQLDPIVKSPGMAGFILEHTAHRILEIIRPDVVFMLRVQYRMNGDLSQYISEEFYGDQLLDGLEPSERVLSADTFRFPGLRQFMWEHTEGEEQTIGTSYGNHKEAMAVIQFYVQLMNSGLLIKIISPYEGQRCLITQMLMKRQINPEGLVQTADSMQGSECDVVILSMVRSQPEGTKPSIGFLSNRGRLCVMMSRAKFGLIIVGNAETLKTSMELFRLLNFYAQNNSVVENYSVPLVWETNANDEDIDDVSNPSNESTINSETALMSPSYEDFGPPDPMECDTPLNDEW